MLRFNRAAVEMRVQRFAFDVRGVLRFFVATIAKKHGRVSRLT